MFPTIPALQPPDIQIPAIIRPADEKPKSVIYIVQKGDSLTSISKAYKTTVLRLWAANKVLKHPDQLNPGDKLTIPNKDDKLKSRPIPGIIQNRVATGGYNSSHKFGGYSSSGNTYSVGYCTWYVKNQRSNIPNGWGDASRWLYAAQGMGWPTGSTPRVGAVAWARSYGHVAIVIGVDGGTVSIREMNFTGWNQVSTRSASTREFLYIY